MKKVSLTDNIKSLIFHKDDIKMLQRLEKFPGFRAFMLNKVCPLREKWINIEYHGNGVKISQNSLPELENLLTEVCFTLNYAKKPDMSLMWHFDIAATTEGAKSPHITLLSGAIDLLSDNELKFLLGHEIGHQACGHKPYHMFLECLYLPIMESIPGGPEWLSLIRTSLLQWYRISDFTADRIGLLACQDIEVALSTLMKMSGVPIKYYSSVNVKSFITQAEEFGQMLADMGNKTIMNIAINADSQPWLVIRALELYKWYKSGSYENILCKH